MSDSMFLSELIEYYYVMRTQYKCGCGESPHSVLSQTIFAQGERGTKLPVRELISRYSSHYSIGIEAAANMLPELPLHVLDCELEVEFCFNCLPTAYGNVEKNILNFPAPVKIVYGSVKSENLNPNRPLKPSTKARGTRKDRVTIVPIGNLLNELGV